MSIQKTGPMDRKCAVIFDWDDTLFPTTSLQAEYGSLDTGLIPDESLQEHLVKVLEEALRLAPEGTYIVTNAIEGWVKHCVENFYPAALPLLDRVHVVSARHRFFENAAEAESKKATCPEDLFNWKATALQSLVKEDGSHALSCSDAGPLNIIAIGDAPTDAKAARTLAPHLPTGSWLKTVQLMPAPSLSCFGEQLRLILGAMGKVLNHAESASLCVGPLQSKTPAQPKEPPISAPVKDVKSKPIKMKSGYADSGGCRSAACSPSAAKTPEVPMVHH
eukprot:gnl/MRDRNA2_/MRDRNA2_25128_c0_seq2.p1 gnl/MRDRNA2_/MRDRNA2_25128_c0~~gnl/MRDRNA2_/MRDRNA2_25128_c0_seq2.p1  ORF type:complete len:277 (+),score=58.62 gnl/MRDRNA2_/MRDRNA2_25128_c0_seq2:337-1167(+)